MENGTVLIGVLKSRRDLDILLEKLWYRIPLVYAPKRKAAYAAFYEPEKAGRKGLIRYYGEIKNVETAKRAELIPEEPEHPMAQEPYLRINFHSINRLAKPVINANSMRISFAFTCLGRLLSAKTMAELLGINPIEELIGSGLERRKMLFSREHLVLLRNGRRYRLDFAFFGEKGRLDVECDGEK